MKGLVIVGILLVFFQTSRAGWTNWLDRDDYLGDGDIEDRLAFLSVHPKLLRPCYTRIPTQIQARIVGDELSVMSSTRYIEVGPDYGLKCEKEADGPDCLDYEVLYRTPYESQWLNNDRYPVDGDSELKAELGDTEVQWSSNVISWRTRPLDVQNYGTTDRHITMGPRFGFSCRNEHNTPDCHDYEVRFYCQ